MIPTIFAGPSHFIFLLLISSLGIVRVASETSLQSERGIEESFTCEWESKTLTCPTGQGIVIDFANYGRTTHPVCVLDPVRDKPNTCSTASHTNFIATFCNGQSSCVVPATNSFFGDPCFGVFKYLQIKYHCEIMTPSVIDESFTCEGESKTLTCLSGSIMVDYANYGRTTHAVCVLDPVRDKPTNCFTASHTNQVGQICNGQSSCVIPGTNSFFGDPCFGVFKYLHVKYHCVCPSDVVESFTCEGESKTLTCPNGKSIVIDFANYGRTSHGVCVLDPVRDKPNTCSTASHTNQVNQLCNGKSNCNVPATNSFFGDPCFGVFKYLQIRSHCA